MPIDFTKPVTTGNYATGVLQPINEALIALSQFLDPAHVSGITGAATGAKRLSNGDFEQFDGTSWGLYSLNYARANGQGANGTWPINVTGSAGSAGTVPWSGVLNTPLITQLTPSFTADPFTVARRSGEGFIYATYFNGAAGAENPTISNIIVTNPTDGFFRKATLAHLGNSLTVPWGSIAGRPSGLSAFNNDVGFITSSALSPYAVLASGPGFHGRVHGNIAITNGGLGLGAITVSTTTGPRFGMVQGDLHLVY